VSEYYSSLITEYDETGVREKGYSEISLCFAFALDYETFHTDYFNIKAKELLKNLTIENALKMLANFSIDYSEELDGKVIDDNDLFNLDDYKSFSALRTARSIILEAIEMLTSFIDQNRIADFKCPIGGVILVARDRNDEMSPIQVGTPCYYLGILEQSRILRKVDKDA
jgi:hypothetical protein